MLAEQRADPLLVPLRIDDGVERVLGAEGVPQREDGVVGVGGILTDLLIHATVASIDVAGEVRGNGAVIERGVEDLPLVVAAAGDLDVPELFLPLLLGFRDHAVEIPSGDFGHQIALGPVHVYRADANLHQDLLVLVGRKLQLCLDLLALGSVAGLHGVIRIQLGGEGFRKHGMKVDAAVGCPTLHVPPAADFPIIDDFDSRFHRLAVLKTVLEVDDDAGLLRLRKRVAVHARSWRGGEFRLHLETVEQDTVVSRTRDLVLLVVGGAIAVIGFIRGSGPDADLAGEGHHQHVAIVADPGAAEVGVTEAPDLRVGIIIAAAGIPARGAGVRAELHHPEGGRGSRKGVAVEAGADERIDVLQHIISRRCGVEVRDPRSQQHAKGCRENSDGWVIGHGNLVGERFRPAPSSNRSLH